MKTIIAIDPGTTQSAYCIFDYDNEVYKISQFGKDDNDIVLNYVKAMSRYTEIAIEMIASYGMPVGKETFTTVLWIGRFYEASNFLFKSFEQSLIFRKEECLHLCHSNKAGDGNIVQALRDRFGQKGTKKEPGFFYGFKDDIWQAFAVGVTYCETKRLEYAKEKEK